MGKWWRALAGAVGLAGWLASAQAVDSGAEVMERAGAVLGRMKESGQAYRDLQFRRGHRSADARANAADKAARQLANFRDELAALQPRLQPGTRFSTELGAFVLRWPDADTIRRHLLDDGWGERIQTDITSLWLQAPDKQSGWKTPFPLFRP